MLIFFKPTLGAGFDGGGIAGGYVIPTESSKKKIEKTLRKKRKAIEAAPEVTPAEVVQAVKDDRLAELQQRLQALSLEVEIEVLKEAQSRLEQELQAAQLAEEERQKEEQMLLAVQQLLAEGERLLAEEQAEVEDILTMLDDEIWTALSVHEYQPPVPRRRRK